MFLGQRKRVGMEHDQKHNKYQTGRLAEKENR